jgi:Na+:H+ antiporter, NhaA family
LTSLAIMDDLGAIIIIAVFYASSLSFLALGAALFIAAVLFGLNAFGITRLEPYLAIGVMLWVAMLFSGIHATLAGVIVAMTIPLTAAETGDSASSPLCRLEDRLGHWVAFLVLPVFGLCQCRCAACRRKRRHAVRAVWLGIAAGLFIGKQMGIMVSVFAAT